MLKREKDERERVKKEERESGLGRDHPLAASIACAKCYSFLKIKNKYVRAYYMFHKTIHDRERVHSI